MSFIKSVLLSGTKVPYTSDLRHKALSKKCLRRLGGHMGGYSLVLQAFSNRQTSMLVWLSKKHSVLLPGCKLDKTSKEQTRFVPTMDLLGVNMPVCQFWPLGPENEYN